MTLLDNRVFAVMAALATCLCQKIRDPENGLPDVCYCGLLAGDGPIDMTNLADECDGGQAWVRLGSGYASTVTGVADLTPGNCAKGNGIDIEIGILRNTPIQPEAPTEEEMLATTQLQIADMLVMQQAILCCDALEDEDYVLGLYTPLGPEGGLVGGTWALSLLVL